MGKEGVNSENGKARIGNKICVFPVNLSNKILISLNKLVNLNFKLNLGS